MKHDTLKRFFAMTLALTCVLSIAGCGSSDNTAVNDTASADTAVTEATSEDATAQDTADTEVASTDTAAEDTAETEITEENVYAAISDYVLNEFGQYYDASDVSIPYLYIMDIDDSDTDDIKVYGDFWFYTYKINGDTLETQAGGSYPGCMHLKSAADGLTVTESEIVADGEDWGESAKEIFGDRYDDFIAAKGDDEARAGERGDQIAAYVRDNGLEVTQYQDYGWDPVKF